MDLSPQNFVSVNEILADVIKVVKDESFKINSKGWYTSQIQQALEELSFDTFFDEQHQSFDMPGNLRLELPKGSFNLRQIFAYNGDECTPTNSANIYRKRTFINGKSGNGVIANDTWNNANDPFHTQRGYSRRDGLNPDTSYPDNSNSMPRPNNVNYFSIQNGVIYLSESCRKYQKIMLVYNGIMADIGDTPVVPQFFRQAVKDWVTVKALEEKTSDTVGTNQYGHWAGMMNRYEANLNRPYEGSWAKAEHRSKQLNAKDRRDYKEYFTRLNY